MTRRGGVAAAAGGRLKSLVVPEIIVMSLQLVSVEEQSTGRHSTRLPMRSARLLRAIIGIYSCASVEWIIWRHECVWRAMLECGHARVVWLPLAVFFLLLFPLFLKLSDAASLLISASRTEAYVP